MAEASCTIDAAAEPEAGEDACPGDGLDRPAIAGLTAGHFAVDFCQGMVPALIPYLVADGLSLQSAGGLVFAVSVSSAFVQPLFGHLCDKWSAGWLVPAGAAAAACVTLVGVTGDYGLLLALLAVSGLGVAAFHPEAARLIHRAGGTRPATAMSVFSVGGTAGFALAPLATAYLMTRSGKPGLLAALAVVAAITAWLVAQLPRYAALAACPAHAARRRAGLGRDQWVPFALLAVAVVLRSVMFVGLMTFLGVLWSAKFGQSLAAGNVALTVLLASGVAGTLVGGWLGDRWGPLGVTRVGFVATTAVMAALAAAPDVVTASCLLVPAGAVISLTGSPVVVLGQAYLPARVGTASGVTIGLAVSAGGVAAPFLGRAADAYGLGLIMPLLTGLAAAAAVVAYLLPPPRGR